MTRMRTRLLAAVTTGLLTLGLGLGLGACERAEEQLEGPELEGDE